MNRKALLTITWLPLLALLLIIAGMVTSTSAQEVQPPDHPRLANPRQTGLSAPIVGRPEWAGAWQYGPDTAFQFTRFDGGYYPEDGKVYFMGGRLSDGSPDGSVWSFDPETGVYADTGQDLVTPIANYTMNLLQDGSGDWGFYVLCGVSASSAVISTVQVYYPSTNTAIQLDPADDYPGSVSCTSALNVVYGNKVYVAGGFDPLDPVPNSAETWVFDPTAAVGSRWSQIPTANLGIARAYIMGAVVDDKIYAIGGNYYDGSGLVNLQIVESLDPNDPAPSWDDTSVTDLPEACSEGRAYGFNSGSPFSDPDNTPLGGKIISTCGGWSDENEHVYAYDTVLNTWEAFPSLLTDRRDQAAEFIPDNQPASNGMPGMWVWGGRQDTDANVLTSSEYYDVDFTGGECNLLLVDDDWDFSSIMGGGRPYYTSTLDHLGYDYTLWDAVTQGDPTYTDMAPYDAVVWFTGYDWETPFMVENETEVGAYLDAGGNFLLSSIDYHYAAGLTAFMQSYLGIESVVDDVTELDPIGIAGNPIGDGLGPFTMTRPDNWEIYWPAAPYEGPYDDYAYANPGAAEPFRFNASGESNSTNYDSGVFRTAYLAWPFEWIGDLNDRAEILGASLEWLCAPTMEELELIPPSQFGSGIPATTIPYTLTVANNLGFAETFTLTYSANWPLVGPEEVGPVPNGGAQSFIVEVQVPADANCYETDSGSITAIAQSTPVISDTAFVETSADPPGLGGLQGGVYDTNTSLGVPDAYVLLELGDNSYETWADAEGDYALADVPACTYAAQFNAFGYASQFDVPVAITALVTTTKDAYLAAAMPELSASAVHFHVPVDSTGTDHLTLSNSGSADLNFHISDLPPESIYPLPAPVSTLPSGVDQQLYAELSASLAAKTRFIVYFKEQADLSQAFAIKDRVERGRYVLNSLRAAAQRGQSGLRAELGQVGISYEPRYIVNALVVEGDLNLLTSIAARPEVAFIGSDEKIPAPQPVEMSSTLEGIDAIAWNIAQVNADDVWSSFGVQGEGIVVSNIDTGVQYTHPALVDNYRGNQGAGNFDHNYNWWDPYGDQPLAPYDYHSHGSHTIGTMVGDDGVDQIGMAPDAQWMACNGFDQGGEGYAAELLECAEFILAPWDLNGANPNPDLRPDVVNNSWGGGQAQWWYNQAIYAWRAAGIFPVFSNGNEGPECETTGDPGDSSNVISVGATDNTDLIAGFSSRGPALITDLTKPNVSAPGVSVLSAYNNGGYGIMSGTSMAAPHVGGEAALIWSAVPELRGDVQLTYWIIEQSSLPILDDQCGDPNPPNNVYGWGRIDAYQAVSLALSSPWETPWLQVDPWMGVVEPEASLDIALNFDTTGLSDGECYTTTLKLEFNDPYVVETFLPVELCVSDVADLQVSKSASPTPVYTGETLTYSLTVTNQGPSPAISVTITDTLPVEVSYISASSGCTQEGGIVRCEIGEMASGQSTVATVVVVSPDTPGTLVNQVEVSSEIYDPDLENNRASLETLVSEPPFEKIYLPLVNKS